MGGGLVKQPHPVIARLARERARARLSLSETARRIYVDRRTLRGRETGVHEPVNLAQLDEWAALFGLRLALVPIKAKRREFGEAS